MPEYRHLNIDPMERVQRYKRFYGGLVFDALWSLGVRETMLSPEIYPLDNAMVLAGFALTVKIHNHAEDDETIARRGMKAWGGGPNQRTLMNAVTPGCVICADTGPNSLVAQWGEMSCHLARNSGATGVVIAGNVRDTRVAGLAKASAAPSRVLADEGGAQIVLGADDCETEDPTSPRLQFMPSSTHPGRPHDPAAKE